MKMTTAQVVERSVAVNNNRFYSFFVRLKDQGFSYNIYCCEDGKVSGLGNLLSETNLTVNKEQANHFGLSISSRRGLEKY